MDGLAPRDASDPPWQALKACLAALSRLTCRWARFLREQAASCGAAVLRPARALSCSLLQRLKALHHSTLLTQGAPLGMLRAARRGIPARLLASPQLPQARLAGHRRRARRCCGTLPLRLNDPEPTTQLAERCSNAPPNRNGMLYSTPNATRLLRAYSHGSFEHVFIIFVTNQQRHSSDQIRLIYHSTRQLQ